MYYFLMLVIEFGESDIIMIGVSYGGGFGLSGTSTFYLESLKKINFYWILYFLTAAGLQKNLKWHYNLEDLCP